MLLAGGLDCLNLSNGEAERDVSAILKSDCLKAQPFMLPLNPSVFEASGE